MTTSTGFLKGFLPASLLDRLVKRLETVPFKATQQLFLAVFTVSRFRIMDQKDAHDFLANRSICTTYSAKTTPIRVLFVKMRILISNDDGVYSPGIAALAKAAKRFGEVRIVAPDVEQSSMGHAITASRPLRLKRIQLDSFDAYRVNGTPADCVALGMHRSGPR